NVMNWYEWLLSRNFGHLHTLVTQSRTSKNFESKRGSMGQSDHVRTAYGDDPLRITPKMNHDRINIARQAAEALFVSKPPVTRPGGSVLTSSVDEGARKPRILPALGVQPMRVKEPQSPSNRESRRPAQQIPARHMTRVRTWLKYGMTVRQAAKV